MACAGVYRLQLYYSKDTRTIEDGSTAAAHPRWCLAAYRLFIHAMENALEKNTSHYCCTDEMDLMWYLHDEYLHSHKIRSPSSRHLCGRCYCCRNVNSARHSPITGRQRKRTIRRNTPSSSSDATISSSVVDESCRQADDAVDPPEPLRPAPRAQQQCALPMPWAAAAVFSSSTSEQDLLREAGSAPMLLQFRELPSNAAADRAAASASAA